MTMGMGGVMEEDSMRVMSMGSSSVHALLGFVAITAVIMSALIYVSKCRKPRRRNRTVPKDAEKGCSIDLEDLSSSSGGPHLPLGSIHI